MPEESELVAEILSAEFDGLRDGCPKDDLGQYMAKLPSYEEGLIFPANTNRPPLLKGQQLEIVVLSSPGEKRSKIQHVYGVKLLPDGTVYYDIADHTGQTDILAQLSETTQRQARALLHMQRYTHQFDPSLNVEGEALRVFNALYSVLPDKENLLKNERRPTLFRGYFSADVRLDNPPPSGNAVLIVIHDTVKPGQVEVGFEECTELTIEKIKSILAAKTS